MAYKVPTLDEMQLFLIALFKALLPTRNAGSRFSFYWKLLKTIAGAVTDVHANVASMGKDVMPDTTTKGGLDRWLKIVGTERKGATPSRRSAAGRVVGTLAATASVGDQLLHRATGQLFQINGAVTIPAALYFDADIAAVSVGSATRLRAGEVLEFVSPPAGIVTQVELQLDLDEDGYDAELDGAGSVRLLALLGQPAAGGNQADYVKWALELLGINAAYCYPNRAGLGTVDVAALHAGTGTARHLTAPERAELLTWLLTLAPCPVAATIGTTGLRVLTTVDGSTDAANLGNVELLVTPNGDAAFDFEWDDFTPPVVSLYTAGTRVLTFTTTRPISMQAGHSLVLRGVASVQSGEPMVIEALSGASSVILQEEPDVVPLATDVVYAAGPLTSTIRDAVIAHINSDALYAGRNGPIAGAVAEEENISVIPLTLLLEGMGTANPVNSVGTRFGTWTGALRRGALATIAMYTRGVRNHTVVTPVTDQEAVDYAFPDDASIGVISVGSILIRKG